MRRNASRGNDCVNRDRILQAFKNTVFLLDTTHQVTNPRTKIHGDIAELHAISEAQHLPPGDRSRHCHMKSHYHVSLVRQGDRPAIERLIIHGIWFTGEPRILIGE